MRARRRVTLHVVDTSDHDPTGEARPCVRIVPGKRSEAIDEAEQHLAGRDLELFQRGEFIVRAAAQEVEIAGGGKAEVLRVIPVKTQHMRDRFNLAVDLQRFDKRANDWVSVDCPPAFADAYLERIGLWKLPVLHSVATAPVLRPDGSVLDKPGFDRASGVYYDPRGAEFPGVPPAPTRGAALAALDRLDELIGTFPFVDEVSRSVGLSAILTPIFRRAISAAPLHGITAPVAGSGKSKLVNTAAIVATGHPAPAVAQGKEEAETEKRLTGVLLAGDAVAAIDNAERPLGGEFLCQVVTEPLVAPRLLGTMSLLRVPNTVSWYATGNNLKFLGDMVRRALLCRLDPQCERPELREFETPDPCVVALERRPEFVVAALTIARAFVVAGRPRAMPPLGSFEGWSTWVRDPLIWLGRADPVDAMGETRRDDPKTAALATILEQWAAVVGERRVTAREATELAERTSIDGYSHPDFREALLGVATEAGKVNSRRLGHWLGQVKGRPIAGRKLVEGGNRAGTLLWMLLQSAGQTVA